MSKLGDILESIISERRGGLRIIFLCIIAATTFWFFNALNENYSTTLRYPIELVYDKDKYIPVKELPEDLMLNVSGLGWNLFRNSLGIKVSPLQIALEAPAEQKRIPSALIPGLISDQLNEFQLNFVLTDTLFIDLDVKTTAVFPIRIDSSSISLDEDYLITSTISYSPDSVQVTGPQSLINQLPDVIVAQIPQSEIDEDYEEDIPLRLESSLLKRNPPTLAVEFTVSKFVSEEVYATIRKVGFPEDQNIILSPDKLKVTFKVPQDRVEEANSDLFDATAYFETVDFSDSTMKIGLDNQPKFISEVQIDTSRIKVIFNE